MTAKFFKDTLTQLNLAITAEKYELAYDTAIHLKQVGIVEVNELISELACMKLLHVRKFGRADFVRFLLIIIAIAVLYTLSWEMMNLMMFLSGGVLSFIAVGLIVGAIVTNIRCKKSMAICSEKVSRLITDLVKMSEGDLTNLFD